MSALFVNCSNADTSSFSIAITEQNKKHPNSRNDTLNIIQQDKNSDLFSHESSNEIR